MGTRCRFHWPGKYRKPKDMGVGGGLLQGVTLEKGGEQLGEAEAEPEWWGKADTPGPSRAGRHLCRLRAPPNPHHPPQLFPHGFCGQILSR